MTDPNPYPKIDYGRNINSPDVLIIGAGISGLCTAIDMIKAGSGRNFIIIEKSSQVGGTWNDNIYPGCCCDVLSHLYSYSFEPNPNWSREYPGQEEIHDYLIGVAHKYELYRHIRFNSSVEEARWDDASNKWRTVVRRLGGKEAEIGQTYNVVSDFLVSAVGQLNAPKYPSIKGLDSFQGKIMHSARWDWNYELQGKKVGIIGTGATAAQIIPEIAPACEKLVVFQRTPAWVMPRHDHAISSARQTIYKHVPFIRKRYRASLMDFREGVAEALFEPESTKHDHITKISRQHLLTQLPGDNDASLREALTPNYPFSCKRIIVSDDFYPTMARRNVILETNPIDTITPTGIAMTPVTTDLTATDGKTTEQATHHDLDLLILATGFRTTQFMYPIQIYGSQGIPLSETWSHSGATAYLGITVENLPNFGMLYGPNTNLAHNSLILQIEAQSLYLNTLISSVINAKRRKTTLRLEPRREVVDAYNEDVQQKLASSTFADPNCTSWFKDENGRITTNWCGSAIQYQQRVNYVDWTDYTVGGTAKSDLMGKGQTRWRRRVEETQVSDRALVAMASSAVLGTVGMMAWWAGVWRPGDVLLGWDMGKS